MIFSLLVNTSPHQSSSRTALSFARAILQRKHHIYRLFFYSEGVYNGNINHVTPQNEFDIPKAWQDFIVSEHIDGTVCIAAAIRRGVLSKDEAKRYGKSSTTLHDSMELSGLGQLIEASIQSDKLITFK